MNNDDEPIEAEYRHNKPYIVVSTTNHNKIAELVNKKIEEGYKPIGGVSVSHTWDGDQQVIEDWICQAMIID